jgi:chloramphenicol-sensitive protein RarD
LSDTTPARAARTHVAGPPSGGIAGLPQALGAYVAWGLMPIFFKALTSVAPMEVVAHRIVWGALLLVAVLAILGRLGELVTVFRTRKAMATLAATAVLIAVNWLIYIWAVFNDHVVAAALGYYLNPLLNVVLGYVVLKERLSRAQVFAVALAAVGVAVLAAGALSTLWVSLALAGSFGTYGLIKKMTPVGPMVGMATETLILSPVALGFLVWLAFVGGGAFGTQARDIDLLLIAGGAVTAIPLVLFAGAAKKMTLATLGIIQYLAPTIQFLLGVFVYREALTTAHLIAFPLIWTGLILYSWDAWKASRREALVV